MDDESDDNIIEAVCVSGAGVWAYFTPNTGDLPWPTVVADTVYNRHAPHFAGRITKTAPSSLPAPVEVQTSGFAEPARERPLYIEDEDDGLPRWERR